MIQKSVNFDKIPKGDWDGLIAGIKKEFEWVESNIQPLASKRTTVVINNVVNGIETRIPVPLEKIMGDTNYLVLSVYLSKDNVVSTHKWNANENKRDGFTVTVFENGVLHYVVV